MAVFIFFPFLLLGGKQKKIPKYADENAEGPQTLCQNDHEIRRRGAEKKLISSSEGWMTDRYLLVVEESARTLSLFSLPPRLCCLSVRP